MKPHLRYYFVIILIFCSNLLVLSQQKVGLVLSGGGASGFAHIGVLKALEEHHIRIDYITGTSAGALVGGLYACGYSPKEIEAYVLSDEFQLMASGQLNKNQDFYLRKEDGNEGLISLNFSSKNLIKSTLPTRAISSAYLDFELFKLLAPSSLSVDNNFDSLFVPFRCIASDITDKTSVSFKNTPLNTAVRASMTFPFFISPIQVDGKIMFDGGLYNNFPADVMYLDFNPDFIIGSNVSSNATPPSEEDLISQIVVMLTKQTAFSIPCESGLLIQPTTNIGTFDFEEVQKAIEAGYQETIKVLLSGNYHFEVISDEELHAKRNAFKAKTSKLQITTVTTSQPSKHQNTFVKKSILTKKQTSLSLQDLEKKYYRLYATPQIDFLFPEITKINDSSQALSLKIRKSKEFKLDAGGIFSSRPINTGFIAIKYNFGTKTANSIYTNSYFGKYYGSVKAKFTTDIPSRVPIIFSAYFVMNRWDYFRSFSTFFETVKPSFLIQNELYYGIEVKTPINNKTNIVFNYRGFSNEDDYYQSSNFTSKDTTDKTYFEGNLLSLEIIKNTLNKKQFANSGKLFSLKFKYVNGFENSISGSTSLTKYDIIKHHSWLSINLDYQNFIYSNKRFHLGLHAKSVFNTQSLFSNYTASILAMTSFAPLADMETFFLNEYRSPQYIGIGSNLIFSFHKNIDLRLDLYGFQPFVQLVTNSNSTFNYSHKLFTGETYIASTSLIYHSIVGPLRATINYFPKQTNPISMQVSFGYILFNDRAIR